MTVCGAFVEDLVVYDAKLSINVIFKLGISVLPPKVVVELCEGATDCIHMVDRAD